MLELSWLDSINRHAAAGETAATATPAAEEPKPYSKGYIRMREKLAALAAERMQKAREEGRALPKDQVGKPPYQKGRFPEYLALGNTKGTKSTAPQRRRALTAMATLIESKVGETQPRFAHEDDKEYIMRAGKISKTKLGILRNLIVKEGKQPADIVAHHFSALASDRRAVGGPAAGSGGVAAAIVPKPSEKEHTETVIPTSSGGDTHDPLLTAVADATFHPGRADDDDDEPSRKRPRQMGRAVSPPRRKRGRPRKTADVVQPQMAHVLAEMPTSADEGTAAAAASRPAADDEGAPAAAKPSAKPAPKPAAKPAAADGPWKKGRKGGGLLKKEDAN